MKRVYVLLLAMLWICSTSYAQTKPSKLSKGQVKPAYVPDTNVIAVLPYDFHAYTWIFRNCEPSELSFEDFQKIEAILRRAIADYNETRKLAFKKDKAKYPQDNIDELDYLIDLKRYKRQYIAVRNIKGEKVVWINCFCYDWSNNWRRELVFVRDGGNCFFKLKINITAGTHFDLTVNGDA